MREERSENHGTADESSTVRGGYPVNVFDCEAQELTSQHEAERILFLASLGLSLEEYGAYASRISGEGQGVN